MTLTEAIQSIIQSAKNNNNLITQEFFEHLYHQMNDGERYLLISTMADLGINTRRGSQEFFDIFLPDEDPFSESKKTEKTSSIFRILKEKENLNG